MVLPNEMSKILNFQIIQVQINCLLALRDNTINISFFMVRTTIIISLKLSPTISLVYIIILLLNQLKNEDQIPPVARCLSHIVFVVALIAWNNRPCNESALPRL